MTVEMEAIEALRDSEERFRNLIEGSIQGILIHRDLEMLFANQALATLLGYESVEALLAVRSVLALLPEGEHERMLAYGEARRRGEPVPGLYELSMRRRDGTVITVLDSVRLIQWKGAPATQATMIEITERRHAEDRLRREKEFVETALDSLPGIFFLIGEDRRLLRWNTNLEEISGYTRGEIAGMHVLDFFEGRERTRVEAHLSSTLRDGESAVETTFVARNGRRWPYYLTGRRVLLDGTPCVAGMGLDMSERDLAQDALRMSESRYRALYDDNPSMFFTLDRRGVILSVNRYGAHQLGHEVGDLLGRPLADLHCEPDRALLGELLGRCLEDPAGVHRWELRKLRADESFLWTRDTARVVERPDGGPELLLVAEDITEARDLSERLAWQATHDTLTGLVNRQAFEQRLERVLDSARREEGPHALCYLDLDQFKLVNDTCGHVAGDELLRQLGRLLEDRVRRRDTLARLGGDEFGVLMEHCSVTQALRVAETLRHGIEEFRFRWEGRAFSLGASIGLVPIDSTSGNATQVLSAADAACYVAKDQGRNRIHVYRPDDDDLVLRTGEMQWAHRISQALQENRLVIYAQPIVPVAGDSGGRVHFELLLRMIGPDGEVIPPGAFLPAAERYNLSTRLDRWTINHALTRLAAHPRALEMCTINLSGHSLVNEDFLAFVCERVAGSGVPPGKLCFEITETAAIANLSKAMAFMASLRRLGCRFALDDFGSGLSSFAYLKTLPVDFLKIDGMFVRDIAVDPIDLAMVRSINGIGQVMGKTTVAEFVESEAILDRLREIGVDYAQGYHLGAPRPLDELLPPTAADAAQSPDGADDSG